MMFLNVSPQKLQLVAGYVLAAILVAILAKAVYNIYLHPLRSFPGPKTWAATRVPFAFGNITGDLASKIQKLHAKHGSVVRISPDELSFSSDTAWRTIYGQRKHEMAKSRPLPPLNNKVNGIVIDTKEDHRRVRSSMATAFTDKALREQEVYIQHYVDLLIEGIRRESCKGPVNIMAWFNWTTFDIIGDLAFGEPFGCLERTDTHPWVSLVFQAMSVVPIYQTIAYYHLGSLVKQVTPRKKMAAYEDIQNFAIDVVERRLARKDDGSKDFLSHIVLSEDKIEGQTRDEIHSNSVTLVVGGSETTATALAGTVFLLLTNPHTYDRVTSEVREAFSRNSEITLAAISKLSYLHAVQEETLRLYPPAASTFPRRVPDGGEVIDGKFVPGGTSVGVHQISASRSATNWTRPEEFAPERWIERHDPSSEFYSDKRAALQPFSLGPRNCLGQGLAYAEMRIVMARLLFNFDLELDVRSKRWMDQKIFVTWEKPPLWIIAKPLWRD